mmetsp:Transcript_62276/g.140558  ORF Transcript_62276/g.140558 Transcript_62276/m.140558 type:complete len:203 (+) Transcript_62276:432-1040(+)
MNLLMTSGDGPIMPLQGLITSGPLFFSCWDWSSRTRAIITFDGFCTSPVRGRAITLRWLVGLSARTLRVASSLIRLSSRNCSTSSMRSLSWGGLRLRLRLRRLAAAGGGLAARPEASPAPLPSEEEVSAELAFRRFFFLRAGAAGLPPAPSPPSGMPMGGMPMGGIPIPMGGMPIGPPIMPIMPPIMPMGPFPLFMGQSLVR